MSHAEICPVCKGKGKIDDKPCHGCGGLGWITIQDNNYPIIPYIDPWPPCYPYPPIITYTWTCTSHPSIPANNLPGD